MRRILIMTCILLAGSLDAAQSFAAINSHWASIRKEPSVKAELLTEALFGSPVLILEQRGLWTRVSLPLQRDKRRDGSWGGYRGWVLSSRLSIPSGRTITDYLGKLVSLHNKSIKMKIAVYRLRNGKPELYRYCPEGTTLPDLGEVAGMRAVILPDGGRGLVRIRETRPIKDVHKALSFTERFINHAREHIDTPYLWGGTGGGGLDCSGLVYLSARTSGLLLPRDSGPQYEICKKIEKKDARRGDLVFFSTSGPGPTHVAIYLGSDRILHAFGKKVEPSTLSDPALTGKLLGFGRIPGLTGSTPPRLTDIRLPKNNGSRDPVNLKVQTTLHIASLQRPENAVKILTRLYSVRVPLLVLPVRTGNGLFYAIHAGPFSSKKNAEQYKRSHSRFPDISRSVPRSLPGGAGFTRKGFHAYQIMSLLNPFLALDTLRRYIPGGEKPWLLVYRDDSGRQWSCLMSGMYRDKKAAGEALHRMKRMMRRGMFLRRIRTR